MILAPILWTHIAAGMLAILVGAAAAFARKGGPLHARAGTWFVAAMLVLGLTASILEPFRPKPGSPASGLFVCYFVLTGWVTARRHSKAGGRFEIAAGTLAIGVAALMAWGGLAGSTTPAGPGPVFILAGLCLLAGLGDLRTVLRGPLTPAQLLSRHLWRMCFAFFIATGSFFLGQQKVMPPAVRGAPILFLLAFAPFVLMAFWLVRVRLGKGIGRAARAAAETNGLEAASL